MLLTNVTPDFRFGGVPGPLEPIKKYTHRKQPEINLSQYQLRWQLMRVEAMSKWYQHWRDLSRYIDPKRGWFEGFVPNYNAQYDYRLVMDGDPAHYARIMAAGMSSGLTSPSKPWFRLGLENMEYAEVDGVKDWLQEVEKVLLAIFAKSNIYDAFQQTYQELGLFGTGSFGIYEDYESVIRCRSYTVGEYYLGTDFAGRVNSFARQYWMTVDQLVDEYGWENVSEVVQRAYAAGNRDTWILVYTLCEPNTSKVENYKDYQGKAFRSVTWEAQSVYKQALRVAGYDEFPFMCGRWDMTTTADIYGVGPGWFALGDIKMLYRMKKDLLLGINKLVDPPVLIDGGVEGTANMLPGGITRTSSAVPNAGARAAYQVQPDVADLNALIKDTKQQIASRWYADLFLMMIQSDKTEMTAREVVERHEEKLLMLGPVIGRVKSDLLDPTIDRTFAIALRSGLIPPPPPEIQGMPLKVEYISLLAQAQKMIGTAAIEQYAAFIGNLSGAFPEVKDNFDVDEAAQEYGDALGVPPKLIRSKDQVMQIRNARVKQMVQQQAQQASLQAVEAAKTLADTKVGGGSALEHLLGVGGEAPGNGAPVPGGTA
jgi:hypothetical protein